jgi:hypothetical protein
MRSGHRSDRRSVARLWHRYGNRRCNRSPPQPAITVKVTIIRGSDAKRILEYLSCCRIKSAERSGLSGSPSGRSPIRRPTPQPALRLRRRVIGPQKGHSYARALIQHRFDLGELPLTVDWNSE